MEVRELRIGSRVFCNQVHNVNYKGNYPFTISSIGSISTYDGFVQFEETGAHPIATKGLSGIPLTPEILEKQKGIFFKEGLKWYAEPGNFCIHYNPDLGDFRYNRTDGYSTSVEYVHNLQNLFYSLYGEELEIHLNELVPQL